MTQIDRVHVTSKTRVLEGITATAVTDIATHNGRLLEKTTDYYAQDKQGNVSYLGENTAAYSPGLSRARRGILPVRLAEVGCRICWTTRSGTHPRRPGRRSCRPARRHADRGGGRHR